MYRLPSPWQDQSNGRFVDKQLLCESHPSSRKMLDNCFVRPAPLFLRNSTKPQHSFIFSANFSRTFNNMFSVLVLALLVLFGDVQPAHCGDCWWWQRCRVCLSWGSRRWQSPWPLQPSTSFHPSTDCFSLLSATSANSNLKTVWKSTYVKQKSD